MANFRADPTKARSSKVSKTLNQGERKFKLKTACGLPQNLQKLSRAKKYDATVMLSAMPTTVRIASKTKQVERLGRRGEHELSVAPGGGQKGPSRRPEAKANAAVKRAAAVPMKRRSSPWCAVV